MSRPARQCFDFASYLELEDESPIKHEFLDGQVWAMAGGSPAHAALIATLARLIGNQLEGRPGLREVLLVAQAQPRVELWSRSEDAGAWTLADFHAHDSVPLPSLPGELSLPDVYRDPLS
jgi:Uma2 family endonuclease